MLYPETGAYPWDDALRRARAAMPAGTVKAILWHQGESDANPTNAPLYEGRLRALIARFRAELGNPSLPFLIGQLGRFQAGRGPNRSNRWMPYIGVSPPRSRMSRLSRPRASATTATTCTSTRMARASSADATPPRI